MNRVLRIGALSLILLAAVVAGQTTTQAQHAGTRPGPMQYPEALQPWNTKLSFEMAFLKMPEAVVEEADTYRWPAWTLGFFMGLPENFLVEARLTTQFINWYIQAGPRWAWEPTENLHTYIGADYAYFLGGIGAGGFDNSNRSSFFLPNVTVGYSFGDIALTLKGEANFLLTKVDRAGEITVRSKENEFNGVSGMLFLEQPFWGDTQFTIGFRSNYLKFVYQNWLLFPTTDTYYFIPEFILGVRL